MNNRALNQCLRRVCLIITLLSISLFRLNAQSGGLYFDGINPTIIPYSVPDLPYEYTIEAWVKPDSSDQDNFKVFLYNTGGIIDAGNWLLGHLTEGGQSYFAFDLWDGITSGDTKFERKIKSSAFNPAEWQHIALTYSNEELQLYLNGVHQGTATGVRRYDGWVPPIWIGGKDLMLNDSNVHQFKGELSDVRMWNRVLSVEELVRNKDRCLYGTEFGLILLYKFEGLVKYSPQTHLRGGILNHASGKVDDFWGSPADSDWRQGKACSLGAGGIAFSIGSTDPSLCGKCAQYIQTGIGTYLNSSSSLDQAGLNDGFTFETWFNAKEITENHAVSLVSAAKKDPRTEPYAVQVELVKKGDSILIGRDYSYSGDPDSKWEKFSDSSWFYASEQKWRHLGVVIDPVTQVQTIYLDDKIIGTVSGSKVSSIEEVFLGLSTLWGPVNLLVDNVRIWNCIRSKDEIMQDMNNQYPIRDLRLLTEYNFESGNWNNTVLDGSYYQRHGQIIQAFTTMKRWDTGLENDPPVSYDEAQMSAIHTDSLQATQLVNVGEILKTNKLLVDQDTIVDTRVAVFKGAVHISSPDSLPPLIDTTAFDVDPLLWVEEGIVSSAIKYLPSDRWSDFVFDKEYQQMSLDSLERFIFLKEHLPGIPSEKEVAEEGYNAHEMNANLLQKVEELTLYILEQERMLQEQEDELNELLESEDWMRAVHTEQLPENQRE